ncbi:Aa_trans domain-containing protein [Caenorhabditis elegans]|uniref:Aa_trans domain-containing protein n=1 Tax=Caenorhabditis elegans TaxID=6239 RepID=Q93319_CAEEL|nr:Aa_trans domain-containing protein [Caenorhabditis elegans]CAB01861.1 Aa_trans domain-containing protein [Caenorhabditis elegans]|eukprot:NP_510541.1 Uncharacterized protein CELE_C33A11.2 [Caenorhabditis elegans]
MCVGLSKLGFGPLPVLIALIFFVQSFFVYTIAVLKHDVDPIFPYLSSAADKRPQSCIFAIGANISSVLLALVVFVRYRQLRGIFAFYDEANLQAWNWRQKWFGYIAALGLFFVANVQETAIIPVHMSSAVASFGGFSIYMIFQCYLTHRVTPTITLRTVFYYRVIFTIFSVICFCCSFGFGIAASKIFHKTYPDLPTPRPWSRRIYQPGYELHQISALAEWGCAISQIFFIQSFGPEFEDISLDYYLKSHYVPRGALEQEEYENEYQGYGI